ncbi:hypothetical protein QFC21_003027 [Naganishia friedmannii]|uniref:Uncharacterized protein n=1 Tax=Naganishia friedmannii TaxID=89922 RepID=A0ACC2VRF5_9TREE|nr:hypothetical protein QFC21_003027 [Naganishia friedmannii]
MYDVTIIGAGFAGLTAAYTILKKQPKTRLLVLEAQQRIGGRCITSHELPGPVDVGCSWIHGYKEGSVVRDLVEELGIECYVPSKAKSLVISSEGPLDASLASRLTKNLSTALSAASSNTSAESTASLASEIFSPSSQLFNTLSTAEQTHARALARTLEIGMGVRLEDVSLRWFGYEDSAKGTDAGVMGGYDVVIQKLVQEVKRLGGEVRVGQQVDNVKPVHHGEGGVEISIKSADVDTKPLGSKLVICTIPLSVLQQSHTGLFPSPSSLSLRKIHAIANTHVGQLGKIVLSYSDAWWGTDVGVFNVLPSTDREQQRQEGKADQENAGLEALVRSVPLVVASFAVQPTSTGTGIEHTATTIKPHPTLLIYLPVPVVNQLESRSASEVGEAVHEYLASCLPKSSDQTVTKPVKTVLTNWSHDPYSLGATSTPLTIGATSAGVNPTTFIDLGRPEALGVEGGGPKVLFAGEHTSVNSRGSVAGAVESGIREGRRAVGLLQL